MKTILLPSFLFFTVNNYCQKVAYKDLMGHWQKIFPLEKNSVHYLDFIDSTHYNMIDTTFTFPDLPIITSAYGTLYMNYVLDTSAKYTTIETWAGINPKERLYHTDFYILRKKDDLLLMKYVANRNAKWEDNDTAYLKTYKRVK